MGNTYFFTGYPGFIANQLISHLFFNHEVDELYCLVLPTMKDKAEEAKKTILQSNDFPLERFHIITGDITQPGLGIDEETNKQLKEKITYVFHLAAIYDLAVPKDIAYKVNVEGTNNVNQWVKQLEQLKRYVYFSTAYIAGKREGKLLETELIRPDSFKNYYEETKFEAEVLVDELKSEVPVTIIRPGIVKGHSKTGETVKFDGPYLILNMLDKLRGMPFFPLMGNPEAVVNLVPIDFIVSAVLYLSHAEVGVGKTYHLTDPRPYRVTEIYSMILQEMLKKSPKGKLPISFVKAFLSFSSIRKWLKVEKEVVDYFTWLGYFDCTIATKDLAEAGIQCPDLKDQIPSMIQFYNQHKNIEQYHLQIR